MAAAAAATEPLKAAERVAAGRGGARRHRPPPGRLRMAGEAPRKTDRRRWQNGIRSTSGGLPSSVRSAGKRDADSGEALLALAVGHLQSFLAPEALDPLVVDLPALLPQPLGLSNANPTGDGPWRTSVGGPSRCVERCWPTTAHARPLDPEPLAEHAHGTTATVRGQKLCRPAAAPEGAAERSAPGA